MDGSTLEAMRTTLRGPVIGPKDPEYSQSRKVYNAMIDRRPAAVVRCSDAADVMAAVDFARDYGLELAVRGGGHSGPGLCLVEDGVTLDLSPMRWTRIDPAAKTAWVGGGSQLGDLEALRGVVKFPVRIKCATLSWNTLAQGIDEATTS